MQPDPTCSVGVNDPGSCLTAAVSYSSRSSLERYNAWNREFAGTRPAAVPIDPQLLNRYSYARNNPIGYNDINGEFPGVLALGAVYFIPGVGQALLVGTVAVVGVAAIGYIGYRGYEYVRDNGLTWPGQQREVPETMVYSTSGYVKNIGVHLGMIFGESSVGGFPVDPRKHDERNRGDSDAHLAKEMRDFLRGVADEMKETHYNSLEDYLRYQTNMAQRDITQYVDWLKTYSGNLRNEIYSNVDQGVAKQIVQTLEAMGVPPGY